MTEEALGYQEALDLLFYETEAPQGFLARLQNEQVFDTARWDAIWQAIASLIMHDNGMLDTWAAYDLSRIIDTVQAAGMQLVGKQFNTLTDFERQVLDANRFLVEVFSDAP